MLARAQLVTSSRLQARVSDTTPSDNDPKIVCKRSSLLSRLCVLPPYGRAVRKPATSLNGRPSGRIVADDSIFSLRDGVMIEDMHTSHRKDPEFTKSQ